MTYEIYKNNVKVNTIVAEPDFIDEYCDMLGYTYLALLELDVKPTPSELREQAYNSEAIIEWDGEMLTVTKAATLWQYYAAEGSEKASELTALIVTAKQTIRDKYPDEEVQG